jgi:DNA-binding transcriptional LysR family regulator
MDSLENYRILLSVAKLESFSAAAQALRLTAAKVSRAVADIETEVGAKLLQRTTRKVALTPAGAAFIAQAGPAIDALDAARNAAAGRDGAKPFKSLRMASEPAGGLSLVQPAFASFASAYPAASLTLDVLDRPVRPEAEGYDLVFSLEPNGWSPKSSSRAISSLEFTLAASPSYCAMHNRPQSPQDVLQHKLLAWTSMTSWRFRDGTRIAPRIAHFSNDIRVIAELCIAACGIALLPDAMLRDAISERRLLRLLDGFEPLPMQFVASWPEGRGPSPAASAFIEHLARYLR